MFILLTPRWEAPKQSTLVFATTNEYNPVVLRPKVGTTKLKHAEGISAPTHLAYNLFLETLVLRIASARHSNSVFSEGLWE